MSDEVLKILGKQIGQLHGDINGMRKDLSALAELASKNSYIYDAFIASEKRREKFEERLQKQIAENTMQIDRLNTHKRMVQYVATLVIAPTLTTLGVSVISLLR